MEEERVKLDPYMLKGISDITKETEEITNAHSSVLVDKDEITIEGLGLVGRLGF